MNNVSNRRRRGTRRAGCRWVRCRLVGWYRCGCGFRSCSRPRHLIVGLRNRRYIGCRYGKRLHRGRSWRRAPVPELEGAQGIGNDRSNQDDRNANCNPRDTSKPSPASASIFRRVRCGWTTITIRLRKVGSSTSSATTAAANAPSARTGRGVVIVPIRSIRHTWPLAGCSQVQTATPSCHS